MCIKAPALPGSIYLHTCHISKHSMQKVFSKDKTYLKCLAFVPEMLSSFRCEELHPGPVFIPGLAHSAASDRQRPLACHSKWRQMAPVSGPRSCLPTVGQPQRDQMTWEANPACVENAAFAFHPKRPVISPFVFPMLDLYFFCSIFQYI